LKTSSAAAEQRHQDLLRHMDTRMDDLGFLLRKSKEVKEMWTG